MFRLLWGFTGIIVLGAALITLQATASSPPTTATPNEGDGPGNTPAAATTGSADPDPTAALSVGWISSLHKHRPGDPPDATAGKTLRILRGECESAQLLLSAGSAPRKVQAVRLQGAPARGVEIRFSRVDWVELKKPSGPEGRQGLWPDPLIPVVDVYEGEARNALPLALPQGEARSLWVDVCATEKAAPGKFDGRIVVDVDGKEHGVPLGWQILPQQVPATSTLPTSFGFSAIRAAWGHHGRKGSWEEITALDRLYRTALLRNRISVHGGTMEPPPFKKVGGKLEIDFSAYDREVGPFLEGKVLGSGARATTVELRTHPALSSDEEKIAYWRAIAAHHRKKGWKAILFDYTKDEPKREELPSIASRARLVKKADKGIRVLLTASHDPSLADLVDLWTPNLNCLYVKKKPDEFCPWRAPKAAYRKGDNPLWWYQSCSSHGCGEGEGQPASSDYFKGWPSYVVDAPGARARAMGWLAFLEGIDGELYWDTVFAYSPEGKVADPFAPGALWAFGGNGDGTFFYPGTPRRIGGKTHIPLESMRLVHVRDGLEDYELLRMVADMPGGDAFARKVAREVAPTPYQVVDDGAILEKARERLLDFLNEKGVPGKTK